MSSPNETKSNNGDPVTNNAVADDSTASTHTLTFPKKLISEISRAEKRARKKRKVLNLFF